MQTVDMVIAGVGVAAILATTLGLVFYEEAAGLETVTFQEVEGPAFGGDEVASSGQNTFSFAIPLNATMAEADITVTATRTNGAGAASGSFSAFLQHPNGNQSDPGAGTFSWGAASQGGTATGNAQIAAFRFWDAPAAMETSSPEDVDVTQDWGETELALVIDITSPAGAPGPLGGVTTYSYTVTIAGQYTVYEIVLPTPADPATA